MNPAAPPLGRGFSPPPASPADAEVIHFQPLRRRFERRRAGGLSINIAPMVDMTFLLLIFFVVTTTFEKPEGTLSSRMPQESPALVPLPIKPIVIRLAPAGLDASRCRIALENTGQAADDFARLHDLLEQLKQRPGFDVDTPVVIRGEPQTAWDHMVNAWNAAMRVGYKSVGFAES